MNAVTAFQDIVVIERAGRLAAAVGAFLLSELGATVLRVEDPSLQPSEEPASWRSHPLALAGKTLLRLDEDPTIARHQWGDLLDRADVMIQSSPLSQADIGRSGLIHCDVSAFGVDGADGLPDDANEAILQAIGGIMSTTGTSTLR